MKNISYVINGVLAIAVIILFVLHFTSHKNRTNDISTSIKFESDTTITLPIAYVDVDSLLNNYTYAKEISDLLMSKSENSKATINSRQRKIMEEQQEFQRKAQNNAFISQERAEQEYLRIQKMQADLEQTAMRLENDLALEQLKYNNQLADSVKSCIAEFNKTANYEIIFSNSRMDNIFHAKDKYNITGPILNMLNNRYVKK